MLGVYLRVLQKPSPCPISARGHTHQRRGSERAGRDKGGRRYSHSHANVQTCALNRRPTTPREQTHLHTPSHRVMIRHNPRRVADGSAAQVRLKKRKQSFLPRRRLDHPLAPGSVRADERRWKPTRFSPDFRHPACDLGSPKNSGETREMMMMIVSLCWFYLTIFYLYCSRASREQPDTNGGGDEQ